MYTMKVMDQEIEFEWDEGNLDKSRRKHGITPEEAENVFSDEHSLIIPDEVHSKTEDRFIIVGKSSENRNLFIVFTTRKDKIRIISGRGMHRKEIEKYEKIKKNTNI